MKVVLSLFILFATFSDCFGEDFDFFKRKFSIISNNIETQCELKTLPNFCEQPNGHKILFLNDSSNIATPYHYVEIDRDNNLVKKTSVEVRSNNNAALPQLNFKKMNPFELLNFQVQIQDAMPAANFTKDTTTSSLLNIVDKEISSMKPRDSFKIVNQKKESFECTPFGPESLSQCSILKCSSADKKQNYLMNISLPKNNLSSPFTLNKIEQGKKEILKELDDTDYFEIFHNNDKVSQSKKSSHFAFQNKIFKENPELDKNSDLATFFTTNFYDAAKVFQAHCSSKVKKIFEDSSEYYNDLLAKQELKLTLDSFKSLNFTTPNEVNEAYCNLNGVYIAKENVESVYNILNKFQSKVKPNDGISMQKAMELFNKYSSDESFYWKYKKDGCYARAEIIAQDLAKQNIYADKIWIQGLVDNGEPSTDIRWNYHVAPVIYVKDQATQSLKEYVIDPALFDRPVLKEEWLNKTNKNQNKELVHSLIPGDSNARNVSRNIYSISNRFLYNFSSRETTEKVQETLLKEANQTIQNFKAEDGYLLKLQKSNN